VHEGGGFGLKIENQAVGAQILWMTCRGAQIWVVGGLLGWGKLGFGSWVHAIKQCTRGGLVGAKSQKPATGAQFWPTKCEGPLYQV
jgi:hypothetical protein